MKRLFVVAIAAACFAACGGPNNNNDTGTMDSTGINSDRPLSDSSLNNNNLSDSSMIGDTSLRHSPNGGSMDTSSRQRY